MRTTQSELRRAEIKGSMTLSSAIVDKIEAAASCTARSESRRQLPRSTIAGSPIEANEEVAAFRTAWSESFNASIKGRTPRGSLDFPNARAASSRTPSPHLSMLRFAHSHYLPFPVP